MQILIRRGIKRDKAESLIPYFFKRISPNPNDESELEDSSRKDGVLFVLDLSQEVVFSAFQEAVPFRTNPEEIEVNPLRYLFYSKFQSSGIVCDKEDFSANSRYTQDALEKINSIPQIKVIRAASVAREIDRISRERTKRVNQVYELDHNLCHLRRKLESIKEENDRKF